MGIKDMIARCIERMRGGACATCDNRAVCPAGRWQQAFGPPRQQRRNGAPMGALVGFLGELIESIARPAPAKRCFKREVEQAIEPLLGAGEVGIDRVARELGMSRQTLYRRLKAEGTTFEEQLDAKLARAREGVHTGGALPRGRPQFRESGSLQARLFRSRRLQPRVQALDGQQPEPVPRISGRLKLNHSSASLTGT